MHQASDLPVTRQPLTSTPLPQTHLPSFVGPEGPHIPNTPETFASPDHGLDNFYLEDTEERPSLVEQASTPYEEQTVQPLPGLNSGIIRRSNGPNFLASHPSTFKQNREQNCKVKEIKTVHRISRNIINQKGSK